MRLRREHAVNFLRLPLYTYHNDFTGSYVARFNGNHRANSQPCRSKYPKYATMGGSYTLSIEAVGTYLACSPLQYRNDHSTQDMLTRKLRFLVLDSTQQTIYDNLVREHNSAASEYSVVIASKHAVNVTFRMRFPPIPLPGTSVDVGAFHTVSGVCTLMYARLPPPVACLQHWHII